MARHALKHMKEGGSIINMTSVNAYKGNAKLLDYTHGLALQLVERGIWVNGVAPGPILTPLIPASFSEEPSSDGEGGSAVRGGPVVRVLGFERGFLLHNWPSAPPQWRNNCQWLKKNRILPSYLFCYVCVFVVY